MGYEWASCIEMLKQGFNEDMHSHNQFMMVLSLFQILFKTLTSDELFHELTIIMIHFVAVNVYKSSLLV